LLSSTPGITVVVGFRFIASTGEPFRLKPTQGVYLGRERVEPQPPPEQALGLSSIVSLSHTRKPSSRSTDHPQASCTGAHTRRRTTILPLENNSLRPVKAGSNEELTEPATSIRY